MKTNVFKTGIFDHHKMISTIEKLHLQGKVLKQNATDIALNMIFINLILNSLANYILLFVLLKRMKTVKNFMASVGFTEFF